MTSRWQRAIVPRVVLKSRRSQANQLSTEDYINVLLGQTPIIISGRSGKQNSKMRWIRVREWNSGASATVWIIPRAASGPWV